jgi:phage-related tail fiber protein
MANLPTPVTPGFPDIYQLETTDRVKGGPGGIANLQASQLLERTAYLKKQLDDAVSGALVVMQAQKLKAARALSISGDASWSVSFDGSDNVSAALTLATTGVVAGTYPVVTVDTKGRVKAGRALQADDVPALDVSKITNAASQAYVQQATAGVVGGAPAGLDTLAKLAASLGNDANFTNSVAVALSYKAAKATTLAGYGITDALPLGNLSAFMVTPKTTQSISASTFTALVFQTKLFDDLGEVDATGRFIAARDGTYVFTAGVHAMLNSTTNRVLMLYVNGAERVRLQEINNTAGQTTLAGTSGPVRLKAGDMVQVYYFTQAADTLFIDPPCTYFSGWRIK